MGTDRYVLRRIRHAAPLIVPPALSIPGSPPPTPIQMLGSNANLHSRQSRGVCIGNIADTNEQHRAEFFNQKTTDMNIGIALILVATCFEGMKIKSTTAPVGTHANEDGGLKFEPASPFGSPRRSNARILCDSQPCRLSSSVSLSDCKPGGEGNTLGELTPCSA